MTLEAQISLLTVPQEFCRLCNALLVADYGDDFLPIDDDRPDRGNDGYLKSEHRMFAMHCFKRAQNQSLDDAVRRKMIGDLGKAVALKNSGLWDIRAWTFLSNYPVAEQIAQEVYRVGERAGIDVSWRGPSELALLLQRHPHVADRFPQLQVHDVADQIGRMRDDLQRLVPAPDPPLPYVPATEDELLRVVADAHDLWEYRLFAGVLRQGRQAREARYLDYTLGIVDQPQRLSFQDANRFVSDCMDRVANAVGVLDTVCQESVQENAFGRPGEPGDADAIQHLAGRMLTTYDSLLTVAADLRSLEPPAVLAQIHRLLPEYVARPITALRDCFLSAEQQIGDACEVIANGNEGEPISITLTVDVSFDPELQRQIDAALRRTKWRVRWLAWTGGDLERR